MADALVARGDIARAALVLQRQCQLLVREAWWHLAAVLLPRLLHCQKLLLQVGFPGVLMLLAYPEINLLVL